MSLKKSVVLTIAALAVGIAGGFLVARPAAFAALRWEIGRKFPDVQWTSTEELGAWRADSARIQPVLLDARTEPEFAVSHLAGAQRIDPYEPDFSPLRKFPQDTPIVVYSSVGYRSARVAHRLDHDGFTRVHNLEGSLFQWVNEGRIVVATSAPTTQVHPYGPYWNLLLHSRYRAEAVLPDSAKRSVAP